MKQFRGCSKVYTADIIFDAETGKVSYGTPVKAPSVKNISREIAGDSEEVWADNGLDDTVYAGASVNRNFGFTRIDPVNENDWLGNTKVTFGNKTVYGTAADGSKRPYKAWGYALHDGDPNKPCLLVWAFRGIVNTISQVANTIDRGTGSEGQEAQVTFHRPQAKWNKTNGYELDITLPVDENTTAEEIEKWFKQVVTYDNFAELYPTT